MNRPEVPRAAWDFIGVDDSSLEYATLYEYARTSDKLRNSIWGALQTKSRGKRICEHILAAIKTQQANKSRPWPDCFPDGVWRTAQERLLKATVGNYKLCHIIMKFRPDFANPWMKFPIAFKRNHNPLRILCTAYRDEPFRAPPEYELSVRWTGATVDEIVADFEKWVRREAKKHPEMRRGKRAQLAVAPLAWLAAYRLHKAGFTFPDAKQMLEQEGACSQCHPLYQDKSGWSGAIKAAKRILSALEVGSYLGAK